ncbi:MAG: glycerol-3-phosphate responsive antiterminator [Bacillota bacterium]|jgi:glycerol uptake operon antiterminator|nr:glycerol-3-phosphate responsive antiterminator [Bacillota bacterium]HHT90522.1 glycerol-3-phosphate responsive antiterminator [Bacillota bacterium]
MINPERVRGERLLAFRSGLAQKPIIAGLKGVDYAPLTAEAGIKVCFYLTGHIFELRELAKLCKEQNQMLFAHVDLIGGIAKDTHGMQVLASEVGIDGVLTTKGYLVTAAQKAGLLGIQRLFMLDSEALKTGLRMVDSSRPDAVEILPALILPSVRDRLPSKLPPMIAGGLVETRDELDRVLQPPVLAVSTSRVELWDYERV